MAVLDYLSDFVELHWPALLLCALLVGNAHFSSLPIEY